jgi:hypothetical protein
MPAGGIVPEGGRGGSVWEDGVGRRDIDAEVLSESRASHAPDPQSVRYGSGEPQVIVQGVIGGPAHGRRPYVDVYWHEGLRPKYMRLTPDEAEEIGGMLLQAARAARQRGETTSPDADGAD